jgi:hypothetical protein
VRHAFVITCTVAFAAVTLASPAQPEAAVRHIDRAGALLFAEGQGNPQEGLLSLIDAVAELTAGAGTSQVARTSVQAARQQITSGRPVTEDRVRALLRDAYEALDGGKAFQQTHADDMSELMEQLKLRMQSARKSAADGRADESARALLSVALAIVTPMPE